MAATVVAQLESLLQKLQAIDLQNLDAELQKQLSDLSVLAAATESHIDSCRAEGQNLPQVPPAEIEARSVPSSLEANGSPGPKFPWVDINPSEMKSSESALTNPDVPREFGMPFKGVLPLEPPLNLFVWPPESISEQEKPALERLTPAPAAPRPEFGCYPQASEYILNSEPDHSYRAGLTYAAPFNTEDMEIASQQMLNIQMPPNIQPARFDFTTQSFVCDPIPGKVKIPIGIPMVHHINGDPNRAVTIVCAHNLDSLMHYEGPKVKELIPWLMTLTWGVATDTSPRIPGIFELPGLQRNIRSKDVDLTKIATGNGSFNLADYN
ncbi:hypothetical protein B0H16DRAFT_1740698 [Mycena metata]|uniref:Uncharacterized protein n=1 Tax=Mycena metata TaxID=1033252 RepID=A0AAD7MI44_9AGAR|nr:hypothetical protein B0H16DRAFT_1740698 [Mycena metata]